MTSLEWVKGLLRKAQLVLFRYENEPEAAGSRGGKFYYTRTGHVRYGDRPAPAKPPDEPPAGADLVANLRWMIARTEYALDQERRSLERVQVDAAQAPAARVRKLGTKWAVRAAGSDQDFPTLFDTRREALEMAARNAATALEMRPHRIAELEATLEQEREDLARAAAERRPPPGAKPGIATKLRQLAAGLAEAIRAKRDPAISHQHLTERRARIAGNMSREADLLERQQRVLLAMADAVERGTLPPALAGVTNRAQLADVMSTSAYPEPGIHRSLLTGDLLAPARQHPDLAPQVAQLTAAAARPAGGREWWVDLTPDEAEAARVVSARVKPPASANLWSLRTYLRLRNAGIASREQWEAARAAIKQLETPVVRSPDEERALRVKQLERELIGRKWAGYFPTPHAATELACQAAHIEPGMRVLEPSAGKGDMAEGIRRAEPTAAVEAVEWVGDLANVTEARGFPVHRRDFMSLTPGEIGLYDRVVMNPPFEHGADMDHVRHAYTFLKPGGRLVAIMSEGPFFREQAAARAFRAWLDGVGGDAVPMPEGSFTRHESSDRTTGVRTRLVTIDKPADEPGIVKAADYARAETALAHLATQRAAVEKDLFYLEEEDLPLAKAAGAEDRVAQLVHIRAAMIGTLDALEHGVAEARLRVASSVPDTVVKARRLHGRTRLDGLAVSIENRRGSVRRWYDPGAQREGTTTMRHPYGYLRRTIGVDGDQVDCFLGPLARGKMTPTRLARLRETMVYVIHTRKPPDFRELDEQKCMLGFESADAARAAFREHYDDERFLGQMDALTWPEFKAHVRATAHGERMVRGEVVTAKSAPLALVVAKARSALPGGPRRIVMHPGKRHAPFHLNARGEVVYDSQHPADIKKERAEMARTAQTFRPVVVRVPSEWEGLGLEDLQVAARARLLEFYRAGTRARHPFLGWIRFGRESTKATSTSGGGADPIKLRMVADLPRLLAHAVYHNTVREADRPLADHHLYGRVALDGRGYNVAFVVRETPRKGRRFYNHRQLELVGMEASGPSALSPVPSRRSDSLGATDEPPVRKAIVATPGWRRKHPVLRWAPLALKAHVHAYQRTSRSGSVVEVKEHEDQRQGAQPKAGTGRPMGFQAPGAAPLAMRTTTGSARPVTPMGQPVAPKPAAGAGTAGDTPQTAPPPSLEEIAAHIASYRPTFTKAREQLERAFPGAIVAGRLKETQSLHEKLTRKDKPLEQIEDIAGVRITFTSCDEAQRAVARVRRLFKVRAEDNYLDQPKAGYRSHHFVLEFEGRPVELQLRTERQTRWADFSHDTAYKTHGQTPPPELHAYLGRMSDYYHCLDGGAGQGQCGQAPDCPPVVQQQYGCLDPS